MANAARDPFWRAAVSAEVAATPTLKGVIEQKCTRCHAPLAGPAPESPGDTVLAHLAGDAPRAALGTDGVSCTLCHQIRAERLGTEASFTGRFVIAAPGPIFGPHQDPFTRPMQHHTGYTPTYSTHVMQSAPCATCHTLDTQAVRPDGSETGQLLHEQSPYREWRNSVYNDEGPAPQSAAQSCQGCHMPRQDVHGRPIATAIAHNPGGRDWPFLAARSPFGQHLFFGGNTYLTTLLRDHHQPLRVAAPSRPWRHDWTQRPLFCSNKQRPFHWDHCPARAISCGSPCR